MTIRQFMYTDYKFNRKCRTIKRVLSLIILSKNHYTNLAYKHMYINIFMYKMEHFKNKYIKQKMEAIKYLIYFYIVFC